MAAMFTILFWCALQVSLFLVLAAPVYLVVRRRNPSAGTAVAASSLATVIVLSGLAVSPWPRWSLDWPMPASRVSNLTAEISSGIQPTTNAADGRVEAIAADAENAAANESLLTTLWRAAQYNGDAAPTSVARGEENAERFSWPTWIVWAIVAGVAFGAAHLLISLAAVRRLIGRSTPLNDRAMQEEFDSLCQQLDVSRSILLYVSAEIATPATVGMFRPAIVLPTTWTIWSSTERRAVLAHELAHIAGRDFAAWLVARGAVVLHFYHPLVRWFVSRLQLDQELAADDTAARLLGDRKAYLQVLASLALATPHERLAGSLRTFIPTRSLLVRRVEMLRTNESRLALNRTRGTLRWATLPLLGTLALLAAGLRPAAPASAQAAEPKQSVSEIKPNGAASQYDFAYLPKDFLFFLAMRPSEITASPRLAPLAELFSDAVRPGIPAESMEQATFAMAVGRKQVPGDKMLPSAAEYTVIRTNKPVDFEKRIAAGYGGIDVETANGRPLLLQRVFNTAPALDRSGLMAYFAPNETTLVGAPRWLLQNVVDHPNDAAPPADAAAWNREAKGPLLIRVNLPAVKAMNIGMMGGAPLQMFQPIVELANDAYITIEDRDPLILRVHVACKSPEDAAVVDKTVTAALLLLKNLVDTQLRLLEQQLPGVEREQSGQDLLGLLRLGRKILDTAKVNVDGSSVTLVASVDDPQRTISESLVPQIRRARQAAQLAQSTNNLKQLGLAAHIFMDRFRTLPAAIFYGKSSYGDLNKSGDNAADVPRSWRVELLPLIGEENLYQEYRLDQPWDSEANLAVLQKMPAIYRAPYQPADSTNAAYFAVVGPGTIMGGKEGLAMEKITDGMSNTILFVEAERDVPWTKPQDVEFEPNQAAPALGGWGNSKLVVVFADGHALQVAADAFQSEAGRKNFQRLVQFADGEQVEQLQSY